MNTNVISILELYRLTQIIKFEIFPYFLQGFMLKVFEKVFCWFKRIFYFGIQHRALLKNTTYKLTFDIT